MGSLGGDGEVIHQGCYSVIVGPAGLKEVRIGQISLLAERTVHPHGWSDAPMASLFGVHQATKDGGGVEDRPAHEIHASGLADQSTSVHISDEAIVLDGIVVRDVLDWVLFGHIKRLGAVNRQAK